MQYAPKENILGSISGGGADLPAQQFVIGNDGKCAVYTGNVSKYWNVFAAYPLNQFEHYNE